jgi:hypothetical protein
MILTPDNEYAAVLDACVLLPMPLCDTLLRLAEEPSLYRPLWSTTVLEEVERNLRIKLGHTTQQSQYRIDRMRFTFPEAEVYVPPELLKAFDCLPDIHDRHVLAAADRGGAHAIVTCNVKHFPVDCLERFDLYCQTPDEFLVHQFHISPSQVITKIEEQATNLQRSLDSQIQALAKSVPEFAKLLSQR